MKLRCAVARAMLLLPTERRGATIVRESDPSVLKFKTIKDLSSMFAHQRQPKLRKSKASRPNADQEQRCA